MSTLHAFLTGMSSMAFLVGAAFFLRFWRETHDRFFAWFSAAFAILAVNRAVALVVANELRPYLYVVRLAAFLLIVGAVVAKNRGPRST